MTERARSRAASESALIVTNLALLGVVLIPAYVVAAVMLDVVLGRGEGDLPARLARQLRDRWWVPLIYVFCAPFVMVLLRWLDRGGHAAKLRLVALAVAPLAYAMLFLFFFAAGAPSLGALVRAVLPGVVAVMAYAAVMRLPQAALHRRR